MDKKRIESNMVLENEESKSSQLERKILLTLAEYDTKYADGKDGFVSNMKRRSSEESHIIRLLKNGRVETDYDPITNWEEIISIHSISYYVFGLQSTGNILVCKTCTKEIYAKNDTVTLNRIINEVPTWKNIKKLIIEGKCSKHNHPYEPYAIGLCKDGSVKYISGVAKNEKEISNWKNVSNIFAQSATDVGALLTNETIVGIGRFKQLESLTGVKRIQKIGYLSYLIELDNSRYSILKHSQLISFADIKKIFTFGSGSRFIGIDNNNKFFSSEKDSGINSKNKSPVKDVIVFPSAPFSYYSELAAVLYDDGKVRLFELNSRENSEKILVENAASIEFDNGTLIAYLRPDNDVDDISAMLEQIEKEVLNLSSLKKIKFGESNGYEEFYSMLQHKVLSECGKPEQVRAKSSKPLGIEKVYCEGRFGEFFFLTKDRKVLYQSTHNEYNDKINKVVSTWEDIVDLAVGRYALVGLRSDGTVITNGDYECSDMKDITAVAQGFRHMVALKKDGTVLNRILPSFGILRNDNYALIDTTSWKNVKQIAANPSARRTYALTEEGKILISGENSHLFDVDSFPLVTSMAVVDGHIFALDENGNMIDLLKNTQDDTEYIYRDDLTEVWNVGDFLFGKTTGGETVSLSKKYYINLDFRNVTQTAYSQNILYCLLNDGTVKAYWYEKEEYLIKAIRDVENISNATFIKPFGGGIIAITKEKKVTSSFLNLNIFLEKFENVMDIPTTGGLLTIREPDTLTVLYVNNEIKDREELLSQVYNDVKGVHLYDDNESFFIEFKDGNYLSFGRITFSSRNPKNPLCTSAIRLANNKLNQNEVEMITFGYAEVSAEGQGFIITDKTYYRYLSLFNIPKSKVIDCKSMDEQVVFLREDGIPHLITSDRGLDIYYSGGENTEYVSRETRLSRWRNIKNINFSTHDILGIKFDRTFVRFSEGEDENLPKAKSVVGLSFSGPMSATGSRKLYRMVVLLDYKGNLLVIGKNKYFNPNLPVKTGVKQILSNRDFWLILTMDGDLWSCRSEPHHWAWSDGVRQTMTTTTYKWNGWEKQYLNIKHIEILGDCITIYKSEEASVRENGKKTLTV